jgi:zinc transporter ZupT
MSLLLLKLVSIVLILISDAAGAFIPRSMSVKPRGRDLLQLGTAFAAGVILGVGIIHLIGDGIENITDAIGDHEYPFSLLFTGIGILIVVLLGKVLVRGKSEEDSSDDAHPYLIMIVLGVHSIIAGIALGLEPTVSASLLLLFAIIAHRIFAAFALGISFVEASFERAKYNKLVTLYVLFVPIGVFLGISLSGLLTSNGVILAEGIVDAIAAGTFIYVGLLGMVVSVFSDAKNIWGKFFLLCLGFALMAVIAIWL